MVINGEKSFWRSVAAVAVPVAVQGVLQASFGLLDQVMVGQLGSVSIAAIGIGNKYVGLFITVLCSAAAAAAVMFAQYFGSGDEHGVGKAFKVNGVIALMITLLFMVPGFLLSSQIISAYTTDAQVIPGASRYLWINVISFAPLLGTVMLSTLLRNIGYAKFPMVSGAIAVGLDTLLNYIFIFGKLGLEPMGVDGAAISTTISRFVECALLLVLYLATRHKRTFRLRLGGKVPARFIKRALIILLPILAGEVLWGFGETLYGVVYGRIGTEQMAAMTLTGPVQDLLMRLFIGLSTAAGVIVGESLGKNESEKAYRDSIRLLRAGVLGALVTGALLSVFALLYVRLFNITPETAEYTKRVLWVFSAFFFVKAFNLVFSCGVVSSGGETKYAMILNMVGTWGVGVPIGFLSAFVWKLPIHWVYACICTEEALRMLLGLRILRSRRWMKNITE